jgi:ketosteroid isomerase-like protein
VNRRSFIIAFALAFPGVSAMAHPPAILSLQGTQGVAEEVEIFRKAVSAAIAAKDVIALRKFYADSFTHTHTSSKVDGKDARIVSALAGESVIENLPSENVAITVHAGGWAAVATGISPIRSTADGKTYAVHWTVTYTRNQDQWQLAASHATRGKELTQ